jgi:hypothetical protein
MHVGNNMGIMTTLKKPTPESPPEGRGALRRVRHVIGHTTEVVGRGLGAVAPIRNGQKLNAILPDPTPAPIFFALEA